MENELLVRGDRVQLQQVVPNLILNAVEAMSLVEQGARDLSISTEFRQSGDVLVAVRDSGPGIETQQLDRLFKPFYTTKSAGLGMGLSICRSIVNAHGGRLWADANQPRGAVFRFTVPTSQEPSEPRSRSFVGAEGEPDTLLKVVIIHRLRKIAKNAIAQCAGPHRVVRKCGYEDRRDRVPGVDKVPVQLRSGHAGHVDVSDQAGGLRNEGRCQEIGGGGKDLDRMAQRRHELSH